MAKDKTAPAEKNEVPDGDEVVGNAGEARLKLMSEINDRNDRELAKGGDLKDVEDDETVSEFVAPPEGQTDEEIVEEELARAEEEANSVNEPEETVPEKHRIKVNGKEIELTTAELIERAQKVEAADDYLKKAAEKYKEAERVQIPAPPQPSKEDVAAAALERKRAIVRAIQMGSEEEAMAALDQIQGSNPSLREDDISRIVEHRIVFNDAVSKFQSEYADLVNDPRLLSIVMQRDKDLLAQGDKRDYLERYRAIGNEVREWRDSLAKPAKPEPEKPSVSEKQVRKASVAAVPKGAGAKAPQATDDDEREESPSEIIASMAKARGGPQWLRG